MTTNNQPTPSEEIEHFLKCQKERIKKLKAKYNIKTKKER